MKILFQTVRNINYEAEMSRETKQIAIYCLSLYQAAWPNPKQATDEKQVETAVDPNAVYSEHVVSSPETAYTENIASESDVEEKTTGFFYRCRT